jgi:hypothetical protein
MFKDTKIKRFLLGMMALYTREELTTIDPDFSMSGDSKNGAIVHKASGIPSSIHLKEFLKEHHLNIDPKAFANANEVNLDVKALPTPAAGQTGSAKAHQKSSNSVA